MFVLSHYTAARGPYLMMMSCSWASQPPEAQPSNILFFKNSLIHGFSVRVTKEKRVLGLRVRDPGWSVCKRCSWATVVLTAELVYGHRTQQRSWMSSYRERDRDEGGSFMCWLEGESLGRQFMKRLLLDRAISSPHSLCHSTRDRA